MSIEGDFVTSNEGLSVSRNLLVIKSMYLLLIWRAVQILWALQILSEILFNADGGNRLDGWLERGIYQNVLLDFLVNFYIYIHSLSERSKNDF